jgi:hypothetical protein
VEEWLQVLAKKKSVQPVANWVMQRMFYLFLDLENLPGHGWLII